MAVAVSERLGILQPPVRDVYEQIAPEPQTTPFQEEIVKMIAGMIPLRISTKRFTREERIQEVRSTWLKRRAGFFKRMEEEDRIIPNLPDTPDPLQTILWTDVKPRTYNHKIVSLIAGTIGEKDMLNGKKIDSYGNWLKALTVFNLSVELNYGHSIGARENGKEFVVLLK